MALNLAPYNTAMRIGQGFNTYTHEICVNDAVIVDDVRPGGDHFQGDTKQISQIVTYCTRHVSKLSEITDAMNVSAALSIKTATVGGGLSGSYVNSDKFKESDINFFVQVQVVNQTIMAEDVTKFQPLPEVSDGLGFTRVYGDSYISGFIEGGELDAVISIKTTDRSHAMDIKASLEANFGKGVAGGSVNAAFGMNKSTAFNSSETTITVNWNGGGDIKDADETWSIETLTKVAAAFPTKVAACPQRTYAILTKYENLRSFQLIQPKMSALDYDLASFYTNDLLDAMMSYKNLWKEIHTMAVAHEFDQIDLLEAPGPKRVKADSHKSRRRPDQSHFIDDLIFVARDQPGENKDDLLELVKTRHSSHSGTPDIEYPENAGKPYEPDDIGLERARKDCRLEMIKIVKEVDEVYKNPLLALMPDRDAAYMNPAVFRKLLPVAKEKYKAPAPRTANAAMPLVAKPFHVRKPLPKKIADWMGKVDTNKAKDFIMTDYSGDDNPNHEPQNMACDFDHITNSTLVSRIEAWVTDDRYIDSIRLSFRYNDIPSISHGKCKGPATHTFNVNNDDKITQVNLQSGALPNFGSTKVIFSIEVGTARGKGMYMGAGFAQVTNKEALHSSAPYPNWSFKGFWVEEGTAFDRMGMFYGLDSSDPVGNLT